jgi:uncharacterized membrane protein YdjX (TVP38/TMEM64 family)
MLAIAWGASHLDITQLDAQAAADRIRAAGPLGPVVLLGLLILQCVVAPLPSEPLMMAAGFLYGPAAGLALSWGGVVLGASACFVLAAGLGHAFVHRMVNPERLQMLDAYVRARGISGIFFTILVIRLFAFSSFDVVSYGCGLLRLPFRWFLFATALGVVPKAFAFSYLGANVSEQPPWLGALALVGTFGIFLATPWLLRAWRRRSAATALGN